MRDGPGVLLRPADDAFVPVRVDVQRRRLGAAGLEQRDHLLRAHAVDPGRRRDQHRPARAAPAWPDRAPGARSLLPTSGRRPQAPLPPGRGGESPRQPVQGPTDVGCATPLSRRCFELRHHDPACYVPVLGLRPIKPL